MAEPAPPTDRRQDPTYLQHAVRHIPDDELFAALGNRFRSYNEWADHWASVAPDRVRFVDRQFLLGTREEVLGRIAGDRDAILSAAGRVMNHDIQGWGDVSIRHGDVVDFNADYGQSGKYGFHYWWWSQPLLHAHLLTGDPAYLSAFDRLFNQWYEQRDQVRGGFPHLDVIWYELGLGIRNRPFLEYYSLRFAAPPATTHERMLKTLLGAARWLYEEQCQGYRDGNWQIMGSYGLAFIASLLPEFTESADWLSIALTRLGEHADRDFFPDGCHSERVPSSYSVVAYRDLRNLVTLLGDHPACPPFRQHLTRAARWFSAILPPDQILPAINDGERAPLPPVLRDDLPILCSNPQSLHLPHSGFTAMRSGPGADARFMLINHGPYGGGHSHADCLSFQLHAFGRPLAIDSGIGRTYDDPNHAPWYVRSKAHNMVVIDGEDLDRKTAVGEDIVWAVAPGLEYFAATHRGYEASKGVVHRRHIAFVDGRYWVIYDVLSVAGAAREITWELHPPYPMTQADDTFSTVAAPGLVVAPAGDGWTATMGKGWASVRGIPGFDGTHAQIPWIRFAKTLPARANEGIAVLLYPFEHKPVDVRLSQNSSKEVVVERHDGRDEIQFVDNTCSVRRWRGERLDSTAVARHTLA